MRFADEETAQAYREAWEDWLKQLERVHRVFLEDEEIRPEQLKGLLNREARKKQVYDEARERLLGIEESATLEPMGDTNPFKRD